MKIHPVQPSEDGGRVPGLGLFELEAMSFPRHTLISAVSLCLALLAALKILSFLLLLEAVGWLPPGFRHTPMDRVLSWP